MKTRTKALLALACAVLTVVGATFGTLAYLTDSESVENTFTVGQVHIKLDEAKVNVMGEADGGIRIPNDTDAAIGNTYHLIPGHTYVKDPTVTVLEGSDSAYVRMLVTVNYSSQLDQILPNANLLSIFGNLGEGWSYYADTENADNTRTYEFRYAETVSAPNGDVKLPALFTGFTVPGELTNDDLALLQPVGDSTSYTPQPFQITVVAHAIQAAGFDTADAAWQAFKEQVNP